MIILNINYGRCIVVNGWRQRSRILWKHVRFGLIKFFKVGGSHFLLRWHICCLDCRSICILSANYRSHFGFTKATIDFLGISELFSLLYHLLVLSSLLLSILFDEWPDHLTVLIKHSFRRFPIHWVSFFGFSVTPWSQEVTLRSRLLRVSKTFKIVLLAREPISHALDLTSSLEIFFFG